MKLYNYINNVYGLLETLRTKISSSQSQSDTPLENTSNINTNGLVQTSIEKYNKVTNSIQDIACCAFSKIKKCGHNLKKTIDKVSALWARHEEGSKSNILHKKSQLKKEEQETDSILKDVPKLFQLAKQQTLRKERQLKKEKIDDSILIDAGKFFKREEDKIESKDIHFHSLGNTWIKENKIVKIIDSIRKLVYSIFSKIKMYNFYLKNKVLSLFTKEVDFKACHHDLKEIVHKGLALRELNKQDPDSHILHKKRQLKKEEITDMDSVLKDVPLLQARNNLKTSVCSTTSLGKAYKQEEQKIQFENPPSSSIWNKDLVRSSLARYHKVVESIQNVAHSVMSQFHVNFHF